MMELHRVWQATRLFVAVRQCRCLESQGLLNANNCQSVYSRMEFVTGALLLLVARRRKERDLSER